MKTSNLTTRIAMIALFLGVLVYFGFYIANSFSKGLTTVLAYADSVDVGVEAAGLVVRQERVLTAEGGYMVETFPSEGEKVAGGETVATLYASASGMETRKQIQMLEGEVAQLESALNASATGSDSARVEGDLVAAIAGFHASSAQGNLSNVEQEALQLRTLMLRRDYAYGDSAAVQELQGLIAERSDRIAGLRASLGAASTVIRAPQPGVFSGLADGFEALIGPEALDELTPSRLLELERRSPTAPDNAIGKLITSSTWYFAAAVAEGQASRLREGERYTVTFSQDCQAPMTLERISDAENGRKALVFSCRSQLSQTTLLRRQTVNIVTEHIQGIRVPRSALRVITQTETDKQTGAETEITITGVYTLISRQAEFTPVNVLYQGEDFFLVEPADPDSADRLRDGDEIILYTVGLSDGKVMR